VTDPASEQERLHRIEIATAILLSLAGLISAWASYQASLWGGIQASHYAQATAKATEASRLSIIEGQEVGTDRALFMAWLEAAAENDQKRMAFFEERFSPEMLKLFVPWRKTHPANYADAQLARDRAKSLPRPAHPEGIAARQMDAASRADLAAGDRANSFGDKYVAATVVLALVLFLGGISPLLKRNSVRAGLLVLAALLGLAAAIAIFSLPVAAL
jgi:hypothetical protein